MDQPSLDINAALVAEAKKLRQQAEVQQPSSVEGAIVSDKPTEEVQQPEVAPESPKEPPKEEPKAEQPPKEEIDEPVLSWDDSVEDVTVKEESKLNLQSLGSALNLKDLKDENDLIAKFNELNTKLKQYEEKSANFINVPDELKEVLDVAAKGGNWKSYLSASTIDYGKLDPVEYFERVAAQSPRYRNPDGSFNEAAYHEAMDAIQDSIKELQGTQMLEQKVAEQQRLKQQQIILAEQRRVEQDKKLSEATNKLNNLLPVDQFGIKFEPKHSEYLYKGISNGSLLKKHFLDENGGYDMTKVTATIAKAEWAEKMIKHQSDRAKVEAKKELLNKTQEVQVSAPKAPAAPEAPKDKVLTPHEKMARYYNLNSKGGQL